MAVPLKPFVENATSIIAFSAAMIGAILMTIPCILLLEKLKDWYKKRRESKRKAKLPKKEHEPDVEVEYEVIEAAERYIQTDPCADLSDLYLAVSREMFGDSVESFSEKPLIVSRSVSESAIPDVPIASVKPSFFYKRSLRKFSTISNLETIPDVDVSTQTVESNEQLQMSAWLPLEFATEGTETNRPARYQPAVSSNNIICPRRPSRGRDRLGSKDPCDSQANKPKCGSSTHSVCTIV